MTSQDDDPAPAALPTDPTRRIVALDVVRGAAVLGILLINIDLWAFPARLMPNPFSFGVHSAIDRWTFYINNIVFEGSMRGLFSILFGAGFVLLATRLDTKGARVASIYYRRTIWLIIFGLAHAYVLVWPGDILYTYGVVGLFLFPLRKLRPRTLIILVMLCELIPLGLIVAEHAHRYQLRDTAMEALEVRDSGAELTVAQEESLDEWTELTREHDDTAESRRKMRDEIAQTQENNYFATVIALSSITFGHQTRDLIKWNFLDAAVGMLLGMALMKLGVITGSRSRAFYLRMMLFSYAIGLTINSLELYSELAHEPGSLSNVWAWYTYDAGRLANALGHMALIVLFVNSNLLPTLRNALGAVGRMALTNYIMQSVICGLLFYGFGFGLIGALTRFECLYIVFGIWLVQLIISPLWLSAFRFGPLEWLWRTLTYRHPAPMRV